MTNPKLATTTKTGRWYDWRGERYWSSTTIIGGGVPKPALPHWSANEVAAFSCDNLVDLVPLLERGERDAVYDMLKRAPWRKTKKAADAGTAIHEAIEAYVLDKPFPEWSAEVRPKMEAFEQFLADWSPTYLLSEQSVFNRTERYAGTLDALVTGGEFGNRVLVKDVKSGKGVYADAGLQLASYRFAEFIGLPDGSEQPMPETHGGVVLHLPDDGDYEVLDVQCDETVFQAFLYAREVFRWMEQTSKSVVRGPLRKFTGDQTALDLAKAVAS